MTEVEKRYRGELLDTVYPETNEVVEARPEDDMEARGGQEFMAEYVVVADAATEKSDEELFEFQAAQEVCETQEGVFVHSWDHSSHSLHQRRRHFDEVWRIFF